MKGGGHTASAVYRGGRLQSSDTPMSCRSGLSCALQAQSTCLLACPVVCCPRSLQIVNQLDGFDARGNIKVGPAG